MPFLDETQLKKAGAMIHKITGITFLSIWFLVSNKEKIDVRSTEDP
jgi:hypothetical protein